ncbi:FkbM family methyltransferase [Gramella sp. KN1008]|uniref:FkbM family methyltransferase n=1 Tax=Gramella sp. KN1008 TaxID=2529298 RepID=UPI00103A795B|nr:FkbM family methyltransferase [Gramella sp. KN1008]TBW25562.1 FkbM family methyltransferase [Gramella sp. KN1008]
MSKFNLHSLKEKFLLEVYNRCSLAGKRRIISFLRKNNSLSLLSKRANFRGKFQVKIPKNNYFYMINYGGIIEERTLRDGLFKTWENDIGWIWVQLCKCSDVVFDVGANTGIYSLVTKSINPNASVYAFEPSPRNFKKLRKNNY